MSTSSEPLVSVRELAKVYRLYPSASARVLEWLIPGRGPRHRPLHALADVSFDLFAGQALGLLGLNGSGKSTLLKILAGSSLPTAGSCTIRGRVSTLLDLGAGFNPDVSGRANLDLAGMLLGLPPDELASLLPEIAAFSGLEAALDDPVRTYSSGMLMRLGFSIAVHVPFDVLLVDEVLLVGDELFQRRSLRRIRELLAQGRAVVLASHSLGDLTAVCDRLLLIENGRQTALGPTGEVIRGYLEDSERQARRIDGGDRLLQGTAVPQEKLGGVSLVGLDLLDGAGGFPETFGPGQPVRFRIRYRATAVIADPVFRIQIFRNDGLWVFGSNTVRGELALPSLEGEGSVTLAVDALNLLDGDYHVSAGIWPDEFPSYLARAPYDLHDRHYLLRVRSGRSEGAGIVYSPHRWERDG